MGLTFNIKNNKIDTSLVNDIIKANKENLDKGMYIDKNDLQKVFIDLFKACINGNYENPLASYQIMENELVNKICDNKVYGDTLRQLIGGYKFVDNNLETDEFKLNKDHVKVLNSLNEKDFNHVLDGLNNEISKGNLKTKEDVFEKVKQVKALEGIRAKRGFFQKIGDFFTGRMFREQNHIKAMKQNIINNCEIDGVIKNNVKFALDAKDIKQAEVVIFDVDVTKNVKDLANAREIESLKNISAFNNLEADDFTPKKHLSQDEYSKNLNYLADGIEYYNSIKAKASKEICQKYEKSIIDKCAEMGITKEGAIKAISKTDNMDIKFELSDNYYKNVASRTKIEDIKEFDEENLDLTATDKEVEEEVEVEYELKDDGLTKK